MSASGVRHARDEARFQLREPHLARRGPRHEEHAERHDAREQRHQRPLRPLAPRDDLRNRLVPVPRAHAPDLDGAVLRRRELRQVGLVEDQREGALVDVPTRRRAARRKHHAVGGVENRDPEGGKSGRPFDPRDLPRDQPRDELLSQARGVHTQRHEAGQPIARRKREAQLRQKVRAAPAERRLERRDRPLLRRQRAELPDEERRLGRVEDEGVRVAGEREHVAAMVNGRVGPHVEAVDERIGDQPLLERVLDEREIERLGLPLADLQEDVGPRRAQRILQALGDAVGRLLAQLPQDDGRRLAERGDRSELEVEEDRDRNRHRDREADRKAQAPIPEERVQIHRAAERLDGPGPPFGRSAVTAAPSCAPGSRGIPGSA
jgi:hypothetical protein